MVKIASQQDSPEQEERQKVDRSSTLADGDGVLEVRILRPYRFDHEANKHSTAVRQNVSINILAREKR